MGLFSTCVTTLISPPLPVWVFAAGHLSSQAWPPAAAGEGQTPGTPPQPTASPWRAGASSAGCGTCFLLAPRPLLRPHDDKHRTSLMLSVSFLAHGWTDGLIGQAAAGSGPAISPGLLAVSMRGPLLLRKAHLRLPSSSLLLPPAANPTTCPAAPQQSWALPTLPES